MAYRETEHTRAVRRIPRQRLHAARDLVAEQGFAAATAAAVAERSGVAAGTIYRHFPNKPELVAGSLPLRHRTRKLAGGYGLERNVADAYALRLARAGGGVCPSRVAGAATGLRLIAEPVDPRVEQNVCVTA